MKSENDRIPEPYEPTRMEKKSVRGRKPGSLAPIQQEIRLTRKGQWFFLVPLIGGR